MLQKLSSLSRRLERLEEHFKPSIKGRQNFTTYDGESFHLSGIFPTSNNVMSTKPVDYREALGLVAASEQVFKREDLDKLSSEGWQVLIIHYVAMAC